MSQFNFYKKLHFSRSERGGFFILALSLLAFASPGIYKSLKQSTPQNFNAFQQEWAAFESNLKDSQPGLSSKAIDQKTNNEIQAVPFDPNLATKAIFENMQLPDKLIQNIIKYRNAGGQFRKKEDFKKMYGMTDALFEKLAPMIRLKQEQAKPRKQLVKEPTAVLPPPFPFDPNIATKQELSSLGLSPKVIKTLFNFRNKGGRFRKKEDLKKIYGLPPASYQRLETFINISSPASSDPAPSTKSIPQKQVNAPLPMLDINQANVYEWQQLSGIGPAYAKRITNFREKLGGFASIQQIADTYGLPDSTFQKIQPQLQATPILRFIQINEFDQQQLKEHPYINAKTARILVNYRQHHPPFQSIEDLKKVRVIPDEQLNKLAPYLKF